MKHPLADLKAKKNQPVSLKPVPEDSIYQAEVSCDRTEKMGVLILAGGQGTRLGWDQPKGSFELPMTPKKSLFQIHLEKAKKGNHSVAIMTSPLNHEATCQYLESQSWFGLKPDQIDIFQQELIPVCDDDGNLIENSDGHIVKAPDGNGKALIHLFQSGITKKWKAQNIHYVQIVPVDNPLAPIVDKELLACHVETNADLVVKCVERKDPEEKLGIMGINAGRLAICEYSEATLDMNTQAYPLGYTGLFSCTMEFIESVASKGEMPWHLAHKRGTPKKGREAWVWKFETFIIDLFPEATSFRVLIGDRKKCFAPVKSLSGPQSPESVAALISQN